MAWSALAIPAGGDVVSSAWGNALKACLEASTPALAQAAGDVFRASGANAFSRIARGASGTILTAAGTYVTVLDKTALPADEFLPPGSIILWSGSIASIPTGWYHCNGSNGTPNLQDRFAVNAGGNCVYGTSGGATSFPFTHTHSVGASYGYDGDQRANTYDVSNHLHGWSGYVANWPGSGTTGVASGAAEGVTDYHHSHPRNTNAGDLGLETDSGCHGHSIGGGSGTITQTIMPPYVALAYIMRAP